MPDLVLLHGMGVSPRYFEPLLAELRGSVDASAPDLREESDLDGMVRALGRELASNRLLQAPEAARGEAAGASNSLLRSRKVWLLGNSFGCQIIAEFAAREPEAVPGAIFVGPTTDRRRRTWLQQVGRLALDAVREPPSLVAMVARDYIEAGPLRTLRMARAALNDPIEAKLPALQGPLLVVRGEHDPLCPQDWAEEVARRAPRGRLEVIQGAAHAGHYTHPAELARLVLAFLEELQ